MFPSSRNIKLLSFCIGLLHERRKDTYKMDALRTESSGTSEMLKRGKAARSILKHQDLPVSGLKELNQNIPSYPSKPQSSDPLVPAYILLGDSD